MFDLQLLGQMLPQPRKPGESVGASQVEQLELLETLEMDQSSVRDRRVGEVERLEPLELRQPGRVVIVNRGLAEIGANDRFIAGFEVTLQFRSLAL